MAQKLLVIDALPQELTHARISELPHFLRSGDVLVVNDAATFPGSLRAASDTGRPYEVRLFSHRSGTDWNVVLFGDGDWRTPTERRSAVAAVRIGTKLLFSEDVSAEVIRVSEVSSRLVTIRFGHGVPVMWSGIYHLGHPIQYSYLSRELHSGLSRRRTVQDPGPLKCLRRDGRCNGNFFKISCNRVFA